MIPFLSYDSFCLTKIKQNLVSGNKIVTKKREKEKKRESKGILYQFILLFYSILYSVLFFCFIGYVAAPATKKTLVRCIRVFF